MAVAHRGNPHGFGAIVGRERELATIEGFLEPPGPAAMTIEGEAGVGKSTLFRAGIERAVGLGRRVLSARPVEPETEMAFAGLEVLLADVADEVLDELPTPQRVAFEVALLRAEAGPLGIEARAVASATTTALRVLARRAPLVLGIDDLQWLDDASARVLRVALAHLRDEPVHVLAALRAGAADVDLGLARERVTRLALVGLSTESVRSLVRERLGRSLSLPAARRLSDLTAGNPYYALELVASQSDDSDDAFESATLPGLIERRLTVLPSSTRTALGTLAAAGHPELDQVAQLVGDEAVLDPAFAAGVLEQHGQELWFAHPLLAAAAYHALPPGRRHSVHRQLATLCTDSVERARHLAAATVGPDATVADSIESGARAAAERGAPTVAAGLFEQAARLTPASQQAAAELRRVAATRELFAAGEGARALERSRALVDQLPAGDLRAEVLTMIAFSGSIGFDRFKLGEQAVAECETVEARARCLLVLSIMTQLDDVARALRYAHDALELLDDRRGDPALRAYALGIVGEVQGYADPGGRGRELLREAWALQRDHGSAAPYLYLEPATQLGVHLLWCDELDEARELLATQHARASGAGQEASASSVAIHLAELEIRAGNLDRARQHADEALQVEDQGHDSQVLGNALYERAHVAALQGEAQLAIELAQRGVTVGSAVGDQVWPMHNRWVLGQLALAQGEAAQAADSLTPLPAEREALGILEPGCAPFDSDAVEALIAAGRTDEARTLNDQWERLGRKLNRPRLLATGARGRGLIVAASRDLAHATSTLREALGYHERFAVPHERARTLLALGTTLRRAGHRREARDTLGEALACFERLGQPLWAQRTRSELARLAGRQPANGQLTATERRIAELVAQGRSNSDVANTLFITVRTVESNLTRVYRKLEVHNRAELAARWPHLTEEP